MPTDGCRVCLVFCISGQPVQAECFSGRIRREIVLKDIFGRSAAQTRGIDEKKAAKGGCVKTASEAGKITATWLAVIFL